jgi:hypothetical protein
MITVEEIVKLGGLQNPQIDYEFHFDGWEYLYNYKTKTFWWINDGFGEPELLSSGVTTQDHLFEILDSLNLID